MREQWTDQAFWFDPAGRSATPSNEVLEKNIEKFIADTQVEGRVVKLR